MKTYSVYVNGVGWNVEASSRHTAIKYALYSYTHDDTVSESAKKLRRKDPVGKALTINIERRS